MCRLINGYLQKSPIDIPHILVYTSTTQGIFFNAKALFYRILTSRKRSSSDDGFIP